MKVKRVKSGYYNVEEAKYVRIRTGYISSTMTYYELYVRKINSEYGEDRIFYTHKLETLKNFLAQYETEKDLLADYYIARLEGKHELIYVDSKDKKF